MPEALVVDIQLAAPPPGSREQLVDCPPPPGSRAAKLARLKELRAKYGHINSDAAAPPVTSPVRRAEPAVTFEPQSPSRPLVAGGLRWTLAPAALSLEAHHRRYRQFFAKLTGSRWRTSRKPTTHRPRNQQRFSHLQQDAASSRGGPRLPTSRRPSSVEMRRAALLLIAASARGMIVQRVSTSDHAELAFVSSAGGAHVFLHGVDLGSAFAPPTVRIGTYGHIECAVQPFTSTKNRIHCIIQSDNLPAPTSRYDPRGQFVSLPLRVTKGGRHAECWHVGFVNHGCFARFDVGATPRVLRVFTPTVESAGALRLGGEGIDGGLRGAPALAATLYRGATPVLGVCGEKDCQASNMGAETLGCYSRPGAGGDGVSGKTQATQLAVAYSDATHFGCALDALAGGLTGGFFNVSLHGITDPQHRGDAYAGFLRTRRLDVAGAAPFDAELPPRITSIEPTAGSRAGGTDVTIFGSGFGADAGALTIEVAGVGCAVTNLAEHNDASAPLATQAVRCRLGARLGDAAAAHEPLSAFAGERGARWKWESSSMPEGGGSLPGGSLLVPSFEVPSDCVAGAGGVDCRSGWREVGADGTAQVVEGWFEAPIDGTYHFVVRRDVGSTLRWSGGGAADASEVLASADGTTERVTAGFDLASGAPLPVAVEVWESPAWTCAAPPCREDYGAWGGAAATFRTQTVDASFARPFVAGGVTVGGAVASRWRGRFRAPATGLCVVTLEADRGAAARLLVDGAQVAEAAHVHREPLTCLGDNNGCGGNLVAGDGDCDDDSECAGDLVCGTDNCVYDPDAGTDFSSSDDCCYDPSLGGDGFPEGRFPDEGPVTRTRGLSLREGDWHDFEVLETHGAGIDGDAAMSVRLTCDGINGDAFPLNAADGSARRRALALSPWPSLPEDAASSAVSRAVDLVAGEKYWLQLECTMGSDASNALDFM